MENRQIDYFGQFGLHMSMAKERIKDFKKAIKTNGQLYKLNTCHYFAFVANEKPQIEEETKVDQSFVPTGYSAKFETNAEIF